MTDKTSSDESGGPSRWQKSIEGDWFGIPSVFDASGAHCGHDKVRRASVLKNSASGRRSSDQRR